MVCRVLLGRAVLTKDGDHQANSTGQALYVDGCRAQLAPLSDGNTTITNTTTDITTMATPSSINIIGYDSSAPSKPETISSDVVSLLKFGADLDI